MFLVLFVFYQETLPKWYSWLLIALPLSYFIAQRWLESFAFRIALEWWYFIGAGLVALLIAWFTVGLQTVKGSKN